MNALERILAYKREEVEVTKSVRPLSEIRKKIADLPETRGFTDKLSSVEQTGDNALICELKRKSPSAGDINLEANYDEVAKEYMEGGAASLSVLTDYPSFGGSLSDLETVAKAVSLPLLRKEFLIDEYQVFESRLHCADAILVIMTISSDQRALELIQVAESVDLDVLVEVHDEQELERALNLPAQLIGINNRDLKKMRTDLSATETLAPKIPSDRHVVSESGIKHPSDIRRLRAVGVKRFLIGESLMGKNDRVARVRTLRKSSSEI